VASIGIVVEEPWVLTIAMKLRFPFWLILKM
jgi:hypothetical protein